jgi:hypothetical protein
MRITQPFGMTAQYRKPPLYADILVLLMNYCSQPLTAIGLLIYFEFNFLSCTRFQIILRANRIIYVSAIGM